MDTVKRDIVHEIHKPARLHFPRRRTIIKGLDDLWQTDLAEFQQYARENRGYKYALIVIDCFSKFVWAEPLKDKSGINVSKAMQRILNNSNHRTPKNLQSDRGKEFYNNHFNDLMLKYGINHYSTYSKIKAAIVERCIRTIKERMYRMFSLHGSYKWHTKLQSEIVDKYNNTVHSKIRMKPSAVSKKKEKLLLTTAYSNIKISGHRKFQVGDIVRISKEKYLFEKGYTPNWTTELFKVAGVRISNPTVYYLNDMNGRPIRGTFYTEELQKAKHNDTYLVEKIIRKRGDKVYVKWLGFPASHNSWIKQSNIL